MYTYVYIYIYLILKHNIDLTRLIPVFRLVVDASQCLPGGGPPELASSGESMVDPRWGGSLGGGFNP